jgi:hypothetical protein
VAKGFPFSGNAPGAKVVGEGCWLQIEVGEDGAVPLPERIRAAVGLRAGAYVRITVDRGMIVLLPVAPEEGAREAWLEP